MQRGKPERGKFSESAVPKKYYQNFERPVAAIKVSPFLYLSRRCGMFDDA